MIERIRKKKILGYLLILIIGLILVLIIRSAYAFLMADIGAGKTVNINSSSGSLDRLVFIPGNPLTLNVTPATLKENGVNATTTSIPKVSLIANSTNNTATFNYYVYFKMTSDFIYTVNESTPEIMLTITDPNGTQITNIPGLVYKTFGGVSGFDVTNKNATFPVHLTSNITSTSATNATIHEWKFTLSYINLNSDQSANFGKNITTEILIKKEEISKPVETTTFSNYLISNNATIGMDYHDSTLTNGANDNSYRFSGANPNNYVCFGPGATAAGTACPEENQYRIIGIFNNQIKLIKNLIQAGGEVWNATNSNTWSGSTLEVYLNGGYLNSLTASWSNKIVETAWQVGGMENNYGSKSPVATAYNYEIRNNVTNTIYNAKIGLMYVSDYGYATSQNNWTSTLYNYDGAAIKTNNWMYLNNAEWTLSRSSELTVSTFIVNKGGYISSNNVNSSRNSRPVFSILSTIKLNGGNGTKNDPFRI